MPPNDGAREVDYFKEFMDKTERSFQYTEQPEESDSDKKRKMIDDKKEQANLKRKKTMEEKRRRAEGFVSED